MDAVATGDLVETTGIPGRSTRTPSKPAMCESASVSLTGDSVLLKEVNTARDMFALRGKAVGATRAPKGAGILGSGARPARVSSRRSRSDAISAGTNRQRSRLPSRQSGSLDRAKERSRLLRLALPNRLFPLLDRRNADASTRGTGGDNSPMITHLVLFRPRAGLSDDERAGLAETFRTAIEAIPSIRRVRVGRRVTHGRPYEQQMRVDYEYAAMLDFDDVSGLKAYLDHPAHDALATRFFRVLEEFLVYDFEFEDGAGLSSVT